MNNCVLQLENITRTFHQAGEDLHVLRGCNLELYAGETVALIGPSGSGKSTFLHTAGLLERPNGGIITVAGRDASNLDDEGRTTMRRQTIGFVYQFHHLLPEFSALENIMLPQMLAGVDRDAAKRRAYELLDMVGLVPRANHRPARLSGGEQQRVAIVRALANKPQILIADEPTGNLDVQTAETVFIALQELAKTQNLALLMATHNQDLAHRMGRVVELRDGLISQL